MLDTIDSNLIEAVRMVLFETYPPTNPGILAHAAREWYSAYGADAVFKQIISRIVEVCGIDNDPGQYSEARKLFLAAGFSGKSSGKSRQ